MKARRLLIPLIGLLLQGCNSLKLAPRSVGKTESKVDVESPVVLPSKFSCRASQFVFLSDFKIDADTTLFAELAVLRENVYRELRLPPSTNLVQVYLFEERARYEKYMHQRYPDLPRRRAFFVAQPRSVGPGEDLLVYTYWGDRVREDLRHELTHALLHAVLKDVPLWLDEGLAEYYEWGGEEGLNMGHLEQIRQMPEGAFRPNLEQLELLSQVQQMTPSEYRESWAWVHLMLRSSPEAKAVLLDYLQQLRNNPNPGPLSGRLAKVYPKMEGALRRHVAKLELTAPAAAPTARK